MERIGSGAYANVFAIDKTAYKIPQKWATSDVHTVLREGLLLKYGFGATLEGLCLEKPYATSTIKSIVATAASATPQRFVGFAMPRAVCTLDRWDRSNDMRTLERILFQVCSQLRKIHTAGLVHADIKSRNILIYEDGSAKLCDFGLTTHIGTCMEAYTINYRPPELLKNREGQLETSADIWALGMTFYEVLFGLTSLRFTSSEVYEKTQEDVPDDDSKRRDLIKNKFLVNYAKTVPVLEDFLVKALQWDPVRRPDVHYFEWNCIGSGGAAAASAASGNPKWDPNLDSIMDPMGPKDQKELPILLNPKAPSGKQYSVDFIVDPIGDTLSHEVLSSILSIMPKLKYLSTIESVCKSMCSMVQLDTHIIMPHATILISALIDKIKMRTTLACVVGTSFCIFCLRSSRVLRQEVCARIAECSVSAYDYAVKEALVVAIKWPQWAQGLLIKNLVEV